MKAYISPAKNSHMISRQVKQLHRGQRKHIKQILTWADKSSIDKFDRDRIRERPIQINSGIDMSVPDDWFRFADEVRALFREIERLDPGGYAKLQHRLEKREAKKS
jgi:hypothetical protein